MADNEKQIKLLQEISEYFYGCYRNAGGGTRACEKFHDWMCAVDDSMKKLMDADRVKVVRCEDCRFWEPENAEEGDTYGRCMNGNSQAGMTDMTWFCADGERKDDA